MVMLLRQRNKKAITNKVIADSTCGGLLGMKRPSRDAWRRERSNSHDDNKRIYTQCVSLLHADFVGAIVQSSLLGTSIKIE